ncbi:MAG: molecular chaperone DnaJ [Prochlorococcaceae cyanobacterium]
MPHNLLEKIDTLKSEWGVRSRGDALQRLLQQLFDDNQDSGEQEIGAEDTERTGSSSAETPFDETSALVLLGRQESEELDFTLDCSATASRFPERSRRATGPAIDLPGFVRKNTDRLRSSLHPERQQASGPSANLALFSHDQLEEALQASRQHWLDLYGKDANDAVLEASMVWLARDVWPESDSSDGRPFTWSLAQQVVAEMAPSWQTAGPSFEQVMVVAGILEDPFSGSTLALRIPTLIRRFVQRSRQRRSSTSFSTLQNTMTLHGALKLLQLPTTAGQRLTLPQIRDAYRQQALDHHPDSGGSADMMRRLNEAYQFLKEHFRGRS